MKTYMLYNPDKRGWLCDTDTLWLFLGQKDATIFTNYHRVGSIAEEFFEVRGVRLEIQFFNMVRT